jgi:hypothetical protein
LMKEIRDVKIVDQIRLDISGFSNGIYLIKIMGNNLLYFDKIIKTD